MAKRVRRPAPDEDFQDPLSNYDPIEYQDKLERALIEDDTREMKLTPIATVEPSTTVAEAMQQMHDHGIAAVLVATGDNLMGLFSERDVLTKIADRFDDVKNHPVAEFMTLDILCAHETDSPAFALNVMATQGFRHLPILNVDSKLVGILGPRRVMSYLTDRFEKGA